MSTAASDSPGELALVLHTRRDLEGHSDGRALRAITGIDGRVRQALESPRRR